MKEYIFNYLLSDKHYSRNTKMINIGLLFSEYRLAREADTMAN